MKEIRVKIPKEQYQIIEFKQKNLFGLGEVNSSLKNFNAKKVFAWHCSIMVQLDKVNNDGFPTKEEEEVVNQFEKYLTDIMKGLDDDKPNTLFLARITWNGTRELIWRVYEPKRIHEFLSEMLDKKTYIRKIDYRIDEDIEWKLTNWHLSNC